MNIFMTGGAGFLGRAFMASLSPEDRLTVYSRDPGKQSRARRLFPKHRYILGDVLNYEHLHRSMIGHDVVVHAAAMKYVPQGETNVWQAFEVNVDGSRNVASAALQAGVSKVIGISTDKACEPINIYGLTKLAMERLFQEADGWSEHLSFNVVRYGNVISSTGSVIPIFRSQAREGIIKITDPLMTRFWLNIDEAVMLIHQAIDLANSMSGVVIVPTLRATTLNDIARASAWVELGPNWEDRVRLEVIGVRFGEKRHESLLANHEMPYTIRSPYNKSIIWLMPIALGAQEVETRFPHTFTSDIADRYSLPELTKLIHDAPE